ncbi:MAG TPA: hypothetical protein VHM00_04710 [Caldimonas sp.]|nr:hypothetical protein [Caldimonas sp.]HEX2540366.1 hypothetical protein [Caldimonas sp.]
MTAGEVRGLAHQVDVVDCRGADANEHLAGLGRGDGHVVAQMQVASIDNDGAHRLSLHSVQATLTTAAGAFVIVCSPRARSRASWDCATEAARLKEQMQQPDAAGRR